MTVFTFFASTTYANGDGSIDIERDWEDLKQEREIKELLDFAKNVDPDLYDDYYAAMEAFIKIS